MTDPARAICDCGATFKNRSNLMRHKKSSCRKPQHLCPYCMESVNLLEDLNIHLGKCKACPWVRTNHLTQVTTKKVSESPGTPVRDEPVEEGIIGSVSESEEEEEDMGCQPITAILTPRLAPMNSDQETQTDEVMWTHVHTITQLENGRKKEIVKTISAAHCKMC